LRYHVAFEGDASPTVPTYIGWHMPQHDLPHGDETESNLVDFSKYMRRRIELSAQDNLEAQPEITDREIFEHAEYGDGKRPRFSRFDLMWIGLIVTIGWMLWFLILR